MLQNVKQETMRLLLLVLLLLLEGLTSDEAKDW